MRLYKWYWCVHCRFEYYKGKFEVDENYPPEYDLERKLCVRCRKRFIARKSVLVPAFSKLYISDHLIYTWLGLPVTLKAIIKLFFLRVNRKKFPPIDRILKRKNSYNRLFFDFIKDLDRAYQLKNEGQDINLSSVEKHLEYWNLNYNKIKTTINSARIFLENPARKRKPIKGSEDLQMRDFEQQVRDLDSFLNDYSSIKQEVRREY